MSEGNIIYVRPWDDIQVAVGRANFPGNLDPTWRSYNHGIVGGITFTVLGFAVNDYIDFDIQTTHAMLLDSQMDLHIHFTTPTDGTGTRFQFQLDVITAGITGTWSVPTGSPFTGEEIMAIDTSDKHRLLDIADIPASNPTISSIYTMRLTRIAATQDEYVGEVYVKYIDGHIRLDGLGSQEEMSKVTP